MKDVQRCGLAERKEDGMLDFCNADREVVATDVGIDVKDLLEPAEARGRNDLNAFDNEGGRRGISSSLPLQVVVEIQVNNDHDQNMDIWLLG